MKMREIASLLIWAVIGLSIILAAADYIAERRGGDLIEDDSPVEELVEDLIQEHLGVDIDLTPDFLHDHE